VTCASLAVLILLLIFIDLFITVVVLLFNSAILIFPSTTPFCTVLLPTLHFQALRLLTWPEPVISTASDNGVLKGLQQVTQPGALVIYYLPPLSQCLLLLIIESC
jgi:hypothetical protein